MNDKEFTEQCHMLIHSLRLIPKYNPSLAEIKLSQMVIERFKDTCNECKTRGESIKNNPAPKGFLGKLGEIITK